MCVREEAREEKGEKEHRAGLGWAGLGWAGQGRLGRAGQGWAGLGWAVQGWAGQGSESTTGQAAHNVQQIRQRRNKHKHTYAAIHRRQVRGKSSRERRAPGTTQRRKDMDTHVRRKRAGWRAQLALRRDHPVSR